MLGLIAGVAWNLGSLVACTLGVDVIVIQDLYCDWFVLIVVWAPLGLCWAYYVACGLGHLRWGSSGFRTLGDV